MSEMHHPATLSVMQGWSPKFSPEQIRAVLADYQSGRFTGAEIQKKHGLGHNTLYRWVRKYKSLPDPESDLTHLRAEVARLRALVVELAMANKMLSDESNQH